MSEPNESQNAKYDRERCRVCGHPNSETPRDWGCGYCCPAVAPEVPSRDPGKFWKGGIFYPAGNADVVRVVEKVPKTLGYVNAEIVTANGRSQH